MNQSTTTSYRWITWSLLLVWMLFLTTTADAWMPTSLPTTLHCCDQSAPHHQQRQQSRRYAQQAGSFFNQVPEENNSNDDDDTTNNNTNKNPLELSSSSFLNDDNDKPPSPSSADPFEDNLLKMIQKRKEPSLASQPSTINGVPTAGQGFGNTQKNQKKKNKKPPKPYVGIGPQDTPPSASDRRINDPTKPQYDDQGYTLYQDETTGQTSRVFEALVDYPCEFTIKIVGANEGAFVQDLVAVVADSCDVAPAQISHSVRTMGKWTSLTVHAPVQSAEMLYQLYENVDRDPRVRFKF